jgi:prophage regulatory protein
MSKGTTSAPEGLQSIEDIASALGISVQTVARMVKDGRFPKPVKLSARCIRWPSAAVQQYLDRLQPAGTV